MSLTDNRFRICGYTDYHINLKNELKDMPIGEDMWSPMIGSVKYLGFDNDGNIIVEEYVTKKQYKFTNSGRIIIDGQKYGVTCLLCPSAYDLYWKTYQHEKWQANVGEEYYYINLYGDITSGIQSENSMTDSLLRYNNNYFKTPELAKQSPIYKAFHKDTDYINE
jgi:hypothetical protein